MKIKFYVSACFIAACGFCGGVSYANDIKGFAQVSWVDVDNDVPWLNSWLEGGTGVTRYDSDNDGLQFNQAVLEGSFDLSDYWVFEGTLFAYGDGQKNLGVTEALLRYQPITEGFKHTVRIGSFYPAMSLENVDVGWQSPYTYSFSAINSWLGEELRIIGAEYQISRLGRQHNSPHSFSLVGSIYSNNDGFGSLLSWRGWAIHDRQTLLDERVDFADYPSLVGTLSMQPSWVEPFKETDDNPGYYVGTHWRYKNTSDLRLYFYDSRADGQKTEASGQYAWDTRFTSIAWQYRFSKNTRLLTQWMTGSTEMAPPVVGVDFQSYYLMLSHKLKQHRFSFRYDWFDTTEIDDLLTDPNDSQGDAYTLSWRYQWQPAVEVGVEYLEIQSSNENRRLWSWPEEEKQQQLQWVLRVEF